MELSYLKQWQSTGKRLAQGFADQLDDKAMRCAYSKYFYALYLFDGDNGTGPVPLPALKYSIRQLNKRRGEVSNLALKETLGQFLTACTIMFDSETSREEALTLLQSKKMLPTAVEVLGSKVGTRFEAERYEEKLRHRFKKQRVDFNWWQEWNWKIMAVGEWFEELRERELGEKIGVILAILMAIGIAIFDISIFVKHGIIWGIVATFFSLGIGYYLVGILFIVGRVVTNALLLCLKWIFFNIYTLLVFIAAMAAYIIKA